MTFRKWINGIVIAAVERAIMLCAAGVFMWLFDGIGVLVDGVATFLFMASFLYGLAWLFIGMASAIIMPPAEWAFRAILSKLKEAAQ